MRLIKFSVICFLWIFATSTPAYSQTKLLLPGTTSEAEAVEETEATDAISEGPLSLWDKTVAWVWSKQREFHRSLTKELRELGNKDKIGFGLVVLSFLYGMFHAAGPGHGKAALTTYLLTHSHHLKRGVAMGMMAALLQGLTALVLVFGLTGIAGWFPRETEMAALWASKVSFSFLILVGLYLLIRSSLVISRTFRQLWFSQRGALAQDCIGRSNLEYKARPLFSESVINKFSGMHGMIAIVIAIGIRPCSGAVLVLVLASMMGLEFYGAFAVLMMSVGTAMTVISLSVIAVKVRERGNRFAQHRSPLWALVGGCVGIAGGFTVLLLGTLLLGSSSVAKLI